MISGRISLAKIVACAYFEYYAVWFKLAHCWRHLSFGQSSACLTSSLEAANENQIADVTRLIRHLRFVENTVTVHTLS